MMPEYLYILQEVFESRKIEVTYQVLSEIYEKELFLSQIYENNDRDTYKKACELFLDFEGPQNQSMVDYQIKKITDVVSKSLNNHGGLNVISSKTKIDPSVVKAHAVDGKIVNFSAMIKIANALGYTMKLVPIEDLVVEDVLHHELTKSIKISILDKESYEKLTDDKDYPLYEHVGGKVQIFNIGLLEYNTYGEVRPLSRTFEHREKGAIMLTLKISLTEEIMTGIKQLENKYTNVMSINGMPLSANRIISAVDDKYEFNASVIIGRHGKLNTDSVKVEYINMKGKNVIKTIYVNQLEVKSDGSH